MIDDPRFQTLIELAQRVTIVLARNAVQQQLVAFVLVLFFAWALPYLLQRLLNHSVAGHRRSADAASPRRTSWQERLLRWLRAVEYMLFPIVGLLAGKLTIDLFQNNGWRTGLLVQLMNLFWLILGYRVVVSLFLVSVDEEKAIGYRRRFLAPIFLILVIIILHNGFAGTFPISEIELFQALSIPITLRSLFVSVVVLYLFFVTAGIVRELINRFLIPRTVDDPGTARTVSQISYYIIIGIGVVSAAGTLGFNLSALAIIGGGLSVGIGFGLQELVANFFSGILLLFERSLRPGDIIEVDGQRGTVDQLRIRATVLRTLDNVEIFVPNKSLLTSTVSTYTHTDRTMRRMITVGVSYNSNAQDVRRILLEVAEKHGLVLDNPAPSVFLTGFGDSSLNFDLAVWMDDPARANAVLSDLRFMILSEFEKFDIEIPFPQRDLHIRSGLMEDGSPMSTGESDSATVQGEGNDNMAPSAELARRLP